MKAVLTDDQKTEACKFYNEGVSGRQIANHYNVSSKTIYKALQGRVQMRERRPPSRSYLNDETRAVMCRFYEQGYTGLEIEQMLGTPRSVVYRTLRQGTVIRPFTESNRRVSVNHDAFSVITEESAYWIGFLLTDGCVYDNDIELGLASIDKGHLQKFLDFLDADYPIRDRAPSGYPGSTGSSRVKVTSAQLVKDLASFGVVPRKSSVVSAAEPLLYNAAFWRGCVDGDGWVIVGKTAGTDTVGLTGTYELCRQFLAFTESVCQGKRSVSTNGEKLSQLTVRGAQAAVLLDRLYGGAQVYLDRKREKALTILGRAPGC